MKTTLRVFCTVAFLFIIPIPNYALEVGTHKAINEYIAKGAINGFSLDSYLKNQLGFQNGVEEEFTFGDSKNVWTWIAGGGVTEDKPPGFFQIPYLRSINHFHDPINNQGFSGFIFGLLFHGESSIQWSQKPIGGQSPGGHYSWFDTRDYYYKALTSTIKIDREKYFSETFRGLGQLMHLVQDISVPAHARDQFHMGYDYEKFILRYQPRAEFKSLLANPYQSDKSLLNVVSPLAPIPFANLFDSEKYTGSNPEVTVLGNSIGLSEYTNANFFSDWTIFKNYIHPKKENTNAILIEHEAEDGEIDKPYYISGYQSETLALYSYFANIAPDLPGEWKYTLDDTVHEDYAQKLIPRAVGYSAGLLEYFFRGKIEITEPIIDQGNTRVTLKAKNTTPNNEEMTGGDNASIMLVVKYKVPSGQDYFYIVTPEKNGIKSIPRTEPPTEPPTKPIELTFDLSLSPLPIDATDISFQVVYKGKLGKGEGINWVGEENAVCVGFVGLKITAVLLVSTVFGRQNLMLQSYQVNEGTGKISPVISSLIIDGRTPAHPLLVGKSVLLSAYYNSNFPFLETRPISAKSIGAEIDLKQISDEAESYGSMAMIDFTDNIKVIARQNTIGGVNIQTREISSAGAISTDFISSKYGAQGLELFLHGKNVLVFLGGVSLEQIIAQTLAISDDGTLGEDWIDQSLPSGDYPSPGFTATRVSDSTFAIIARYHDEVNPTIPKGYLFTYNISAEGIITPDYVDAREISSDTEIYGYTIFQVHPGIFAITYYIDPYGDYKLETWKIDDDGTIGASPIDTLVLGLWGSYITDFIKISGDIFAFSFADEIDPGSPHDVQERIIPDEDRTFAASLGDWTGDAVLWSIPDAFNVALFNFTPTKNSAKETLSYPNVLIEANGTATFQIYFSTGGPNPPPDSVTLTLTVSDGNYSFVGAPGNPYYFFGWPVRFYVDTPLDWNRENAYVEIKVDVITSPSEYNPSGDSSVWFFAPSVTESWTYVGTPPSTYVKTIRILPTGVIERILDSVQLTVDTPVPVYLNYRKSGG